MRKVAFVRVAGIEAGTVVAFLPWASLLSDCFPSRSISRARKELGAAGRRELAGFEHLIKSLRVNATLDLAPNLVEELVQPTSSKPRKVDEGKARRPRQGVRIPMHF